MKRRVEVKQHKVPFLHEKTIEAHAQLVLDEWAQEHPPVVHPPVPIDDILEIQLGLTFIIEDLQSAFGHPDVLGGIWFGDRLIKVDQSLDPTVAPKMLGRYRFTLAHEIGHWRLHRQHLMDDPTATSLFQANSGPAFVCRSNANPPEETQANAFAAALLMPRLVLLNAWLDWRGTDHPVAISELPAGDYHTDAETSANMAMDQFCKPLAERFEVSAQAMRYRLQKLGLLVKEVEPRLF